MIAPQHTPKTQFLLGSKRMGNFWPFLKLSLDFFPPHSIKRHLMMKLFCQTSSRGQNRRGRPGQSSRSSHFSNHASPSTCCNTAKMPPAHDEHTPSSCSPAASFAPRQGSPHYPTGQDKSIPDRPGHEQTAVTAADCKTWSLTAAASGTESVLTMRSSPHHFCSQGLSSQLRMVHFTQQPAAPAVLPSELYFLEGCTSQESRYSSQTRTGKVSPMALYRAKQMEVDWVHRAQ